MFVLITLVLLIVSIVFALMIKSYCSKHQIERYDFPDVLVAEITVGSIVSTASIVLIFVCCGYALSVKNQTFSIEAEKANITILEKRFDEQSEIVKLELNKYPEFEKLVLQKINPAILLSYPQLKSSETMRELGPATPSSSSSTTRTSLPRFDL